MEHSTASDTPSHLGASALQAIDLFAGAGGLSLGLHAAGFEVVAAVETDPSAAATYRRNFPTTLMIEDDIRKANLARYRGIDLVAGGPPCQPFSVAGKQMAHLDERDMVPEFVRVVKEILPRAFLMENVPGLTTARHAQYLDRVVLSLSALGYSVYPPKILSAADFGVPQRRLRMVLIGFRQPCPDRFKFPRPTHGPSTNRLYITLGEVIGEAPPDEPNRAIVTYARKPILRPSPWAGMLVNGQGRPANPDEPAPTVPASAGGNRTLIVDPGGVLRQYHSELLTGGRPRSGHVSGVRRISVRESARLQSFPDSFEFAGTRSSQYRQVGNAVPPKLAEAIGRSVATALRGRQARSTRCHGVSGPGDDASTDDRLVQLAEHLSAFGSTIGEILPWQLPGDVYCWAVGCSLLRRASLVAAISVYRELVTYYPNAPALANAAHAAVYMVVRPLGLGDQRARHLIGLARALGEARGPGDITWPGLLRMPGVGPFIADSLMLHVLGCRALPRDTGLVRITLRYCGRDPVREEPYQSPLLTRLGILATSGLPVAGLQRLSLGALHLSRSLCSSQPACGACPLACGCLSRQPDTTEAGTRARREGRD